MASSGAKSQFQLLYPVQIYPDFLKHLTDCMINPIDIVKNWNGQDVFFSAPRPLSFTTPTPGADPSNDHEVDLKNVKRRHLQQQLLKKELEMKQIEDQISAIDILDKLREQL